MYPALTKAVASYGPAGPGPGAGPALRDSWDFGDAVR